MLPPEEASAVFSDHHTLFSDFVFFVYQEGNLAITHLDFLLLNNLKSTVQMDVLAICSGMERNGVSKMTTSNREVRIDQIFGTNFLTFFSITRTLDLAKPSLIILFLPSERPLTR